MFYVNSISGLAGPTVESVTQGDIGTALEVNDDLIYTSLYTLKDGVIYHCTDTISFGKIVYQPPG